MKTLLLLCFLISGLYAGYEEVDFGKPKKKTSLYYSFIGEDVSQKKGALPVVGAGARKLIFSDFAVDSSADLLPYKVLNVLGSRVSVLRYFAKGKPSRPYIGLGGGVNCGFSEISVESIKQGISPEVHSIVGIQKEDTFYQIKVSSPVGYNYFYGQSTNLSNKPQCFLEAGIEF